MLSAVLCCSLMYASLPRRCQSIVETVIDATSAMRITCSKRQQQQHSHNNNNNNYNNSNNNNTHKPITTSDDCLKPMK
ncbi:putative mediator of RNA polymerase II transcription subunit 7 [Drosophila grimshawi]|uniref:putative mediator of RNA polymerase II transcription subunit 7 n=1 Tax=Drosophila grimshawi TaxID=7222 RepID=UPI0013EF123C|nr:putative mediator of RNA polymerase II transcription subunit 7 [Drosophila grimshawi]